MRTLVAVDLSPASDEALHVALGQRVKGAPLAICHVMPKLTAIQPLFPQMAAAELAQLGELPARVEDTIRQHVHKVTGLGSSGYELFIDQGIDYAEVATRAEQWKADRIVVGTSGASGLKRVLGSVAERIVRYAPCAVLCVRTRETEGPVIAATDLSTSSVPAIKAAVEEANRRGAPLIVAYAVELGGVSLASLALAPLVGNFIRPDLISNEKLIARESIAAHLSELGAEAEIVVLEGGHAATAIVRFAEERGASLLVVGTRGRTGLARLALGSVAERIIRESPCNVLAMRLTDD
jgi:nucleotide-binding universal stress UspA family protein